MHRARVVPIDKRGRILIVRQRNGYWTLPGGHQEAQETLRETAVREVREETGVSVSIIRALCEVPTTRTTYFLALGKSGQTAPRDVKEIQAAEWVDLETALELLKDDGPWWAEYNIQALKLAFGIP